MEKKITKEQFDTFLLKHKSNQHPNWRLGQSFVNSGYITMPDNYWELYNEKDDKIAMKMIKEKYVIKGETT